MVKVNSASRLYLNFNSEEKHNCTLNFTQSDLENQNQIIKRTFPS